MAFFFAQSLSEDDNAYIVNLLRNVDAITSAFEYMLRTLLHIICVELHPYLAQPELVAFCKQHNIKMMAYSPLGSGDSYSGKSYPEKGTGAFQTPKGGMPLLQNPLVKAILACG